MTKKELREIIKPLVKECINEVLIEEGILAKVISEVTKGLTSAQVITETKKPVILQNQKRQPAEDVKQKINETRKRMSEVVAKSMYGSVDVFAGLTPIAGETSSKKGDPLSGQDPSDPGINLAKIPGMDPSRWKRNLGK